MNNQDKYSIKAPPYLLFLILAAANGLFLTLGMLTYAEPFRFWEYPLSDLGATVTATGIRNGISILFFICAMLTSCLVMVLLSRRFRGFRRALCLSCAAGFLISTFPHNICNPVHSLGAALMVGSLWGLSVSFLGTLRIRNSVSPFLLGHALLQGTILTYAVTFILDSPVKQVTQKLAVLGLLTVLLVMGRNYSILTECREENDYCGRRYSRNLKNCLPNSERKRAGK